MWMAENYDWRKNVCRLRRKMQTPKKSSRKVEYLLKKLKMQKGGVC